MHRVDQAVGATPPRAGARQELDAWSNVFAMLEQPDLVLDDRDTERASPRAPIAVARTARASAGTDCIATV